MAAIYYNIPSERIMIVKNGDVIDLGGKNLRFIEAPFLHWPETMFTYLEEDAILFSCDFFGAHTAFGIFDEDVEDLVVQAKRYFGEIMMPFRNMGKKALDKIERLEIKMIAPGHGPIYKNPERIVKEYKKWTIGETKEKVLVLYVSMWGSTKKMIEHLADLLFSEGIKVSSYDLAVSDLGDVAKELVDSRALVLGAPTVLGGMHPLALYGVTLIKVLRAPIKYGVILSSYGWSGGAAKQALDMLSATKIEVIDMLEINGPPKAEDYEKISKICEKLIKKIRGGDENVGN